MTGRTEEGTRRCARSRMGKIRSASDNSPGKEYAKQISIDRRSISVEDVNISQFAFWGGDFWFGLEGEYALAKIATVIGMLVLLMSPDSSGRRVEFFRDYCLAAHGGLEDLDFYSAGLQTLTVHGAGDSGLLMYHFGLGLDVSYAHLGDGSHNIRVQPLAEATLYFLFLQAGLGPSFDLRDRGAIGADFMLDFGVRVFIGDEYQAPSVSAGGRLDWLVGDDNEFIPSAYIRVSFWFRPPSD